MAAPRKERAYEKYAWVILAVIAVVALVGAVPDTLGVNIGEEATVERIIGMTLGEFRASNPRFFDLYDSYLRFGGWSDVGWSFLVLVLSATAYRRGEKWAWYALWFLPAFFLGATAISMSLGPPSTEFIPFTMLFVVLSLLGLLLPYRKFFPKKQAVTS